MTDSEILDYLTKNNFEVNAQDCIMKMFNTSYQIIHKDYDFHTDTMTITTPENTFTFKWKLGKPLKLK